MKTQTVVTWDKIPKRLREQMSNSVKRGAKLLDNARPGWHNYINVGTLDMESRCRCVFGQLNMTSFLAGRVYNFIKEDESWYGYLPSDSAFDWASRGRPSYSRGERYARGKAVWDWLKEEWLREIYTRRETDKVEA